MFVAHHEKDFVPTFSKVSTDHLVDNPESEKTNYCFAKKSLEKVLNFGSKNLYEPCDSFCFRNLHQQQCRSMGRGRAPSTNNFDKHV